MQYLFNGTWTLALGDDRPDPETATRYVIDGTRAWDEDKPETVGVCVAGDSGFTVTVATTDKQGHPWTETLTVHGDSGARSLSGTLEVVGPDGVAFGDPCQLHRFDRHMKPPLGRLGLQFPKRVGRSEIAPIPS